MILRTLTIQVEYTNLFCAPPLLVCWALEFDWAAVADTASDESESSGGQGPLSWLWLWASEENFTWLASSKSLVALPGRSFGCCAALAALADVDLSSAAFFLVENFLQAPLPLAGSMVSSVGSVVGGGFTLDLGLGGMVGVVMSESGELGGSVNEKFSESKKSGHVTCQPSQILRASTYRMTCKVCPIHLLSQSNLQFD